MHIFPQKRHAGNLPFFGFGAGLPLAVSTGRRGLQNFLNLLKSSPLQQAMQAPIVPSSCSIAMCHGYSFNMHVVKNAPGIR